MGSFCVLSVGVREKLELRPELKPDGRINGLFIFQHNAFFLSALG